MRIFRTLALTLLVAIPSVGSAQVPDAPVRYDDDLPSADFHRARRSAVLARLPPDALVVLFAAPIRNRSNDVDYEYRQSSDFLYLTGSHEPGSVLLMAPGGIEIEGRLAREVLFVPPRDPSEEVWLGRRFGPDRAVSQLGVETALASDRFTEVFERLVSTERYALFHLDLAKGVPEGSELASQHETFLRHVRPIAVEEGGLEGYVLRGILAPPNPSAYARLRDLAGRGFDPASVADPDARALAEAFMASSGYDAWVGRRSELLRGRPDGTTLRAVLDDLRTIKTDEELALLQRAIDITAEAHRSVMEQVAPGWAEYEIEALLEYVFKRGGAESPGFPSIVGSGENSVILHYETNRRTTRSGDLVVIDIGAEYHGYSADVTRTIPVSGRFTEEQRAIYDLVLRAQEAGIQATRAGSAYYDPHWAASRVIAEGLAELGLTRGPADEQGVQRFFMHATSHYLGLDVHDVGDGGPLRPGTVITVEPGIYIPQAEDIDPRWWNIGVRIEDDILVTEGDPINLSRAAPRDAEEIEALMRR